MKLFKVKGLLCAKVGNMIGTESVIKQIKDGTYQNKLGKSFKVLENHTGGVVITRKGYCIFLKVDNKGVFRRKVYFGSDRIQIFGSGRTSAILRNLTNSFESKDLLVKDVIVRVMKFNSLFDKYSDDEIVYSNQTLEHWVYK